MRNKIMNRFVIFAIMLNMGISQVTISPTTIFINGKSPFGTLLVLNGTDKAQEVTVSFPFSYPTSDSTGKIIMIDDNPSMASKYSIEKSVMGFPKSFVLQPNKRQIVRITARSSKLSEPGTYWTRIKTSSSEVSHEVGEAQSEGITAQINFVFDQITTLFYQVGDLTTGISIKSLRTKIENNQVIVITNMQKTGNSPYLGTMEIKIYNNSDEEVAKNQIYVSIYIDGFRKLKVDMGDLPSGDYTAKVKYYSSRDDVPENFNIITDPITQSINFNY